MSDEFMIGDRVAFFHDGQKRTGTVRGINMATNGSRESITVEAEGAPKGPFARAPDRVELIEPTMPKWPSAHEFRVLDHVHFDARGERWQGVIKAIYPATHDRGATAMIESPGAPLPIMRRLLSEIKPCNAPLPVTNAPPPAERPEPAPIPLGPLPQPEACMWARCEPCSTRWVLMTLPMPLGTAAGIMRDSRCPRCGSTSDKHRIAREA